MQNYDEPLNITYKLQAATLSAAADLLKIAGPKGKKGHLVSVTSVITTAVTVAANNVNIGDAITANKFGTLVVPVSSVDAISNDPVLRTTDANLIPADSLVVINTGGEATAGAANLAVTIAWF